MELKESTPSVASGSCHKIAPANDDPKLEIQSKICSHCHLQKSLDEFDKNRSKKDGRDSRCKCCIGKIKAAKYKQKKEIQKRRLSSKVAVIGDFTISEIYLRLESREVAITIREIIEAIACR